MCSWNRFWRSQIRTARRVCLTVRTRNNTGLKTELERLLNCESRTLGDRLCFRLADAADGMRQVMDSFGDSIISAEVARPTLEDVFLESTGRSLTETDEGKTS